jgi:nucleotide sugar dehydrogenase
MKIGIIGMGYVGQAVQASWLDSSHDVIYYDPAVAGSMLDVGAVVAERPGVIFVCVPTPSNQAGACDTSIVKDTLDKILDNYAGIVIVKSTVDPAFWKSYTQYSNLFHVPEFLVASSATHDYLNPNFIFIGGQKDQAYQVLRILQLSTVRLTVPTYCTDLITASLIKYFMNTFLATKVTVLNQFNQLSNAIGANWHDFTEMLEMDERMGVSHNQVPGPDGQYGYGGACFPKDVRAIINAIQAHGVSAGIIEAVDSANTQFRGNK